MKNLIRILMITLLSLIVFNTYAQQGGFKFGLNMANINLKEADGLMDTGSETLIAPRLGFIFDTPVHEDIFIQTGIFVTASGCSFDSERPEEGEDNTIDWVESREKFILLYLELPVNAGYKYEVNDDVSLFGMLGPVFRFMPYSTLAFKTDGDWDNEVTHMGEGDDKMEMFNKFDFALNLEVGAQVDRFQFSLFYSPSFTNVFNDEMFGPDASWKNYNFGLNIGILFGNTDGGNNRRYRR